MEAFQAALPSRRRTFFYILLPFFLFLVFAALPTWIRGMLYGYHTYDLGIYAQAMARLSFFDPNPFLTVRQLHIFSDHFDPVLWTAVPFARLLPMPFAALLVELIWITLAGLFPVWLYLRGRVSYSSALLATVLVFFSAGTLSALGFPVHPTTWSIFPALLLAYAMHRRRPIMTLLALQLLFACKEEFIFVGVMLCLLQLWKREWKWAAWAALVTVVWGVFVFWGRFHYFAPPFENYGAGLLSGVIGDPSGTLGHAIFGRKALQHMLVLLVPFAFLAVIARKNGGKIIWDFAILSIPIFLIRFLSAKWGNHYLPPLIGFYAATILFSFPERRWPRWVIVALCVFLAAVNGEALVKWARLDVPFLRGLSVEEKFERKASLDRMRTRIEEGGSGVVVAEANLVPNLVKREGLAQFRPILGATGDYRPFLVKTNALGRTWVLQTRAFYRNPITAYRWVFLEKPPFGDGFDVGHGHVGAMIQALKDVVPEWVVMEDRYAILVEGDFRIAP